jgi:hypothetical protein
MLSEIVSALKGLKVELQEQLAQQPEYRALLILDRATSQLGDALTLGDERGSLGSQSPAQAEAAEPRPSVRGAGRLVVVHDAAIDITRGEPMIGGAPPAHLDAQPQTPPTPPPAAKDAAGALPARPATIADFRIAAPEARAQDGDSANAPANRAFAEYIVDSAAAPTAAEIVSLMAAACELTEEPLGALSNGEGAATSADAVGDQDPPRAPINLISVDEIDDSRGAASQSETISGLAALYASASELSDAEREDSVEATHPPIAAEDARRASAPASLAPAEDVVDTAPAPTPAATISGFAAAYGSSEETFEAEEEVAASSTTASAGLTATLYESTGDAPELESDVLGPAHAPAVEAPVETAIEAFNRTLAEAAEAAKLSQPSAKAASTRGFLPVFTAQRLAQSRK